MRVVVVGGGFGGLAVAQGLAGRAAQVVVIDRRNHHLFQPLLYQVATAGLAPGDIAEPIRAVLAGQPNAEVLLGEAVRVDAEGRRVVLSDGREIPYDRLVLAAGATHSYFGNDGWAPHAPGLKTIGDALEVRRRLLSAFEQAEWTEDVALRRRLMTFAVIGGGPTGVELAGAIREIAAWTMLRDFRHIDTRATRVVLVEAQPELLAGYPDALRAKARQQLDDLGVEVRTGQAVRSIDADGLTVGEDRIETPNVFWAAGVRGEAIGATFGAPLDRAGRVQVLRDLSVPGHPEIFVVGDLASVQQDGKPVPGVAQGAKQMGEVAVANLIADLSGAPRRTFRYRDLGKMATIGRRRAVADVPGLQISGFFAWFFWAVIHLWFLVAYRSRVVVFTKWILAYFLHDRGSRLLWQGEGWVVRRVEASR